MLLILIIILISMMIVVNSILLKSLNDIITLKGKDSVRLLQALTTSDFESLICNNYNLLNNRESSIMIPTSFVSVKGHLLYNNVKCIIKYNNNDNDYCIKMLINNKQSDSLKEYFKKYIFPLDRVTIIDDKKKGLLCTILCNDDNNQKYMNIFDNNINKYFSKSIGNDLSLTKLEEWKGYVKCSIHQSIHQSSESENIYSWIGNDFISINNREPENPSDIKLKEYSKGFTFVAEDHGEKLNQLLQSLELEGIINPSKQDKVWESLRLATGIPSPFTEIGIPYNATALELGMIHLISFCKGCYTGQESIQHAITATGPIIANGKRLNAVRRHLVGCKLHKIDATIISKIKNGDNIIDENNEIVGVVTTSPIISDTNIDVIDSLASGKLLALVKSSIAINDQKLFITTNDKENIPISVEMLSYCRYDPNSSSAPPVMKLPKNGKEVVLPTKEQQTNDVAQKEAERKAKKLQEMAERAAKLQASKKKI